MASPRGKRDMWKKFLASRDMFPVVASPKVKNHLKVSEHVAQVSLFEWAEKSGNPALSMMFAIPNGGYRPPGVGRELRKEGVKPGVPDIFLAVPSKGHHGMFIEMKSDTGSTSTLQRTWMESLSRQGYHCVVCRGHEEAIKSINSYLAPQYQPATKQYKPTEDLPWQN
jgi:VRR-NUC domain